MSYATFQFVVFMIVDCQAPTNTLLAVLQLTL